MFEKRTVFPLHKFPFLRDLESKYGPHAPEVNTVPLSYRDGKQS